MSSTTTNHRADLATINAAASEARAELAMLRKAAQEAVEHWNNTRQDFPAAQALNREVKDKEAEIAEWDRRKVAILEKVGGVPNGWNPDGPQPVHGLHGSGWQRAARELDLSQGELRLDFHSGELLTPPALAGVTLTPSSGLTGPSYLVAPMVEKAADRRFLYPFLPRQELDPGVLALTEFRQTGSRSVSGSVIRDPVATSSKANLSLSIELATPSLKQLACIVEGMPAKLFDAEPALLDFLTNELGYQLNVAMDAHVLAQIGAATPTKVEPTGNIILKIRSALSAARAQGTNPTIVAVSPKVAVELDTWSDKQEEFTFLTREAGTASPIYGMTIVELPSEEQKTLLIDPAVLGVLYTAGGTMLVNPFRGMGKNEVDVRLEWETLYHVRDVSGVVEITK